MVTEQQMQMADIQRQYVPVELCEKHCVDLQLRHPTAA